MGVQQVSKVIEIFVEDNSVIEREATPAELTQREADAKVYADAKAEEKADKAIKVAEKAALLEKLGITEDEAKLLLG
jgi:antitoxin component of RelBE/YafQ-DinJ toxin-antitoxin module